jgi:hypothetical protein
MTVFTSLLAQPFATGIIRIFAAHACSEIINKLNRKMGRTEISKAYFFRENTCIRIPSPSAT